MHRHGFYRRFCKPVGRELFKIFRFLCPRCGHTVSVLPALRLSYRPVEVERLQSFFDAQAKVSSGLDPPPGPVEAGCLQRAWNRFLTRVDVSAVLAINLSSAFHATRAVLPQMQKRGWGRIINVASAHGLVASVHKSAYVASKHGIVGLTKLTALENAEKGITCNAICPGWVLTPLVQIQVDARAARDNISEEDAKRSLLSEKQPSLQFVTTEQLAGLAVFLCSPAADQIRGAAYNVDGGWFAQ